MENVANVSSTELQLRMREKCVESNIATMSDGEVPHKMTTEEVMAVLKAVCDELGKKDQAVQVCTPKFTGEYAVDDYIQLQGLHGGRWVEGYCKATEVRDLVLTRCQARRKPLGWLEESLKQISTMVNDLLVTDHRDAGKLRNIRHLLYGAEEYAEKIHKFELDVERNGLTR